jgi:hypothetical protein
MIKRTDGSGKTLKVYESDGAQEAIIDLSVSDVG